MKTALKQETLKFPSFIYRGFEIPALGIPTSLIDDLGTSEPAYKLAPKSIPLAWRVGLYLVGRDLNLEEEDAESLPEPVKVAGKLVYSDAQQRKGRGGWHKDGVLFLQRNQKPKGMWPMGDQYVLTRYFKYIEDFEERDDKYIIKPSPDTREELVWLPPGGGSFVVPTRDGAYHPVTGTPFETVKDRKKAIERWIEAGLTEEEAEKELSRFYRKDSGVAAVDSWSNEYCGPLCVNLNNEPDGRGSSIGSFPTSRSAERSEAPKNLGYRNYILP